MNKKISFYIVWILGTIALFISALRSATECRAVASMDEGLCDMAYIMVFFVWIFGTAILLNVYYLLQIPKTLPRGEYWRRTIGLLAILLFLIFGACVAI